MTYIIRAEKAKDFSIDVRADWHTDEKLYLDSPITLYLEGEETKVVPLREAYLLLETYTNADGRSAADLDDEEGTYSGKLMCKHCFSLAVTYDSTCDVNTHEVVSQFDNEQCSDCEAEKNVTMWVNFTNKEASV